MEKFYHINQTVTIDPKHSAMINYHSTFKDTIVYYKEASSDYFLKAIPNVELWKTNGLKNTSPNSKFNQERFVCHVLIENLKPNTNYCYYIEGENEKSSIYHFKTLGDGPFSFLAFCDMQYGNNNLSPAFINKLKEEFLNINLMTCSGDLVDFADKEDEWTNIVDSKAFDNMFFAMAVGDHEYWGDDTNGYTQLDFPYHFTKIFHFPLNGANSSLGTNYYFLHNEVLFIFLDFGDSNTFASDRIDDEAIWFKEITEKLKGKYQYIIVNAHKSLFGSRLIDPAVYKYLRAKWHPIFKDAHVDLVISGHDHIYSRTHSRSFEEVSFDEMKGTCYLDLGSSGTKRRNIDESLINSNLHALCLDLKAQDIALGAKISVNHQEIQVEVFDQDLNLVDNFTIKNKRK